MSVDPAAATAAFAEPAPRRQPRPGRHLRPVRPPTPRRSPVVPILVGTGIVLVALFGLAVMHALLIGGQIRTDDMQRAVAAETEEVHRLRLQVAELESPDRVLQVARDRLGMVPAIEVGYLVAASVPTEDQGLVRVDAAERPTPEEPVEVGTVSASEDGPPDESTAADVAEGDAE